jgi:DNA-binding CsgD family transcriptional regulator
VETVVAVRVAERVPKPDVPNPLVRRAEAEILTAALDSLGERSGHIIELVGEPGAGKTRLLAALADAAAERGVTVLSGRCSELERRMPLHAFAAVLDGIDADGVVARLAAEGEALSDYDRLQAYRTVRALIGQRCGGGMLLLLDDFHWADQYSIGLMDYLTRWPVDAPLLIVVAHRTPQASARLRGALAHGMELGTVDRVELGELSLAQSAELLGRTVDDERLLELHTRGNGNPLYLLALANAASLRDKGAGVPCAAGIPSHFAARMVGELATLTPVEQTIIDAAAVLGEFDLDTLATVADLDKGEVYSSVAPLIRRDLLRPVGRSPLFTWRHPVLRGLCYINTDPRWRVAAHRRAQAVLAASGASAAEQAPHVEFSLSGPDPHALQVLTRAAEDAMQAGDPVAAVYWFQVALGALPGARSVEARRVALFRLLGRVFEGLSWHQDVRQVLDAALRMVIHEPADIRTGALTWCALTTSLRGGREHAEALLDAELATGDGAALRIGRGIIGLLDGKLPKPEELEVARRLAGEQDDQLAESGVRALTAFTAAVGARPGDAVASSATLLNRLTDRELAINPEYLVIHAWAELLTGRLTDAVDNFRRGLTIVRDSGHEFLESALLCGLSVGLRHGGHLADARVAAVRARESALRHHAQGLVGLALAIESEAAAWLDARDRMQAITLGEQAFTALRAASAGCSASAAVPFAAALRLNGELSRATDLLLSNGGGHDLDRLPLGLRPRCYELLTAAALEAGDPIAAIEWARRASVAADALALPDARGHAHLAQAYLARHDGRLAAAVTLFRSAAGEFTAAGMPIHHAWVLVLAAPHVAETGLTDEAATMLRLAAELAGPCGAQWLGETAERLLAGLADRVEPRTPPSGFADLTVREREVASLAKTGKSTREIAAALSLSPRTVDVHLTRIYRKLNIRSRAALANLLVHD